MTESTRLLLRTFVQGLAVVAAAVMAIAVVRYLALTHGNRIATETRQVADLDVARGALGGELCAVVTDLLVLVRHIEEMVPRPTTLGGASELVRIFVVFAEQKRLYDQIRFIGTDGREVLRVNLGTSRARVVPPAELQDKSRRYYVGATLSLGPGSVYLSPLDLNIEHGTVERPLKPVMRFATAVRGSEGGISGILVLNYLGQRLLDILAGIGQGGVELFNRDGYWLRAADPADEWGFMLRSETSFRGRYPDLWSRISAAEQGQLTTPNGLLTFDTIEPRAVALAGEGVQGADTDSSMPSQDDAPIWKLVSRLPSDSPTPTVTAFIRDQAPLYGAFLVLASVGAFVLARARTRHHLAEVQSAYERRFRLALEQIGLAAVALDRDGRVSFCNRFLLDLTGWSQSEVIGTDWLARFAPPELFAEQRALIERLSEPERFPASFVCAVQTRAGERRVLAWHVTPDTSVGREAMGVTAIGEDITEKLTKEAALRQLSQAVEQSPSIVVITDRSGRIEYVNSKFTEITGYLPKEVRGRGTSILKSGDMPESEYADLWRTITAGGEWRGELHNRRKNGDLYWERASISPMRDERGQVTHFLAVKEDISERKHLEAEIAERNLKLSRAQALAGVGRMAAMIAHDLRNPLSSIKVALDVLGRAPGDSSEALELKAITRGQIGYMEAILNDLLAYARPPRPQIAWLGVERLIQGVLAMQQRRLGESGVRVDLDLQPGLPTFPGDLNQLRQLFTNLIGNAIQAMASVLPGERVLDISVGLELDQAGTLIRFRLCDCGEGLPDGADARERLFEPFVTERAKGTGLGLAIVRRIVEADGGRVRLEPSDRGGACALVLLPTVPAEPARRAAGVAAESES